MPSMNLKEYLQMINFQPVSNVLGALLCILGAIMLLLGIGFHFVENSTLWAFGKAGIITTVCGLVLYFLKMSTGCM